ncbi:MAG: FAD-binding oxidoreductase [Gammaproteobacteria bacterium]|nr:FAD-binding oxidoreductase [Gammaproteobacteria bacterium]
MKLESFWLDTAPAFQGGAAGQVGEAADRVDVAIVGGGYSGLSAGLALARRGASVVVLEAGRVIGEASGRNGGQCNNGTAQSYSALVQEFGEDMARRFYLAYNSAVDTVERLVQSENIDCGFRRCGKLKLAAKPEHYEGLARASEALLAAGVDPGVKLVTAAELPAELGCGGYFGGLLQPDSAQMHVGKFGVGLAEAAAAAGARIYEHAAVTGLQRLPSGDWQVSSARGSVQAKQVLVTTGGSGPGPFGWFRRRIVPVGSFAVVTEPLPAELTERLLPQSRNYVTTRHIGNYFRLTPDNRLLFGGRARFAVSNPKSDQKSGAVLRAALEQHFPELQGIGIDYCWGGTVDMSQDRLPRAGEKNGLYYSMGYSGHGVQMSVHMGEVMAEVMAGNRAANPWRDLSWPAIPGHFGKPWFLPLVGLYYQWLDRVQ